MAFPEFQTKEVLNKVLNTGKDALKVDIDNVTLDGSQLSVDIDKENDSIVIFSNTAADGSGTNTVPLVDAAGHTQVDIVSSALPSGGATAANQATIIGHVDGIETLITSTNSKIDTFDAVLDAIKTDTQEIEEAVETIEGAVSGSEMQVDVVAISAQSDGTYIGDIKFGESLPAGSAAIGKLAANSGVDIGDVDVTSLPASTNTIEVVGDAAEDAAVAGNPLLSGGRYDNSERTLDNGDVGALALDPTGALYVREYLGQSGSILVTGTTAVTTSVSGTKFVAIQFIEDTVFASSGGLVATTEQLWPDDTGTGTTIDGDGGAAIDSVTFPQGMTIFGRWDGFTLASGKCIGYLGKV